MAYLNRVDTVNRFLHMNISKKDELQQLVELAAKICDAPIAMITFLSNDTQHIRFKVGTDISEVSYQDTLCKLTIEQKELLSIPDTEEDERVSNNPFVIQAPHIRFYAGSPLTTHDDHNIGTLCVFDPKPKVLTTTQEKMLHRLSRQVTRLLEFEASLQLLKEQYESSLVEETKLRFYFESTSACHLLLDTDLRVLSFNNAMVNVLRDLYHLPISEGMEATDFVESGFIDEFIQNCKDALSGKIVSLETTVSSIKGKISWHLMYEPAFDLEGTIIGVTYSAIDITQTLRDEKTILDQEKSLRKIDMILSVNLHQPMQVIKSAMDSIKEQGYPDEVMEFKFLEETCSELLEKGGFIIATNKENVMNMPSATSIFQFTDR